MGKINFLYLILLISTINISMEQPNLPMANIQFWQDVHQFAGRLIAYKTNGHEGHAYSLENDIKYALVSSENFKWTSGETGYDMSRLLRLNAGAYICALIDSDLKKISLSMRLATLIEVKKIREAITSDKAIFEYWNKEKILLKLDNESAKLASA